MTAIMSWRGVSSVIARGLTPKQSMQIASAFGLAMTILAPRDDLTQRGVNGLGKLRGNALDGTQVLHTGVRHATHTAKALQ